ncbi:hypothetical protein EBR57_10305 [bacterium]|nr:hypothetical protein [bacterium]
MLSIFVGTIFLTSLAILVFAAILIFSKFKWVDLTSNERSQLIYFLFPIGAFIFLSWKLFIDPTFLDSDLCYIFSIFFLIIGIAAFIQKKYFLNDLSRWRMVFRRYDDYFSIFFTVAGVCLLFVGLLV